METIGPHSHLLVGEALGRGVGGGAVLPVLPREAGPPYLGAVLDVVSFVEAQVAQVVGWGPLAGLAGLRGERQV